MKNSFYAYENVLLLVVLEKNILKQLEVVFKITLILENNIKKDHSDGSSCAIKCLVSVHSVFQKMCHPIYRVCIYASCPPYSQFICARK